MLGLILYIAASIYWFIWLDSHLTLYNKITKKDFNNKNCMILFIKAFIAFTWIISFPVYILPLKFNK